MRSSRFGLFVAVAAFGALGAITACSSSSPDPVAQGDESVGEVEVALTNAPSDVSCLRLTVAGSRTDVRTFDLDEGDKASFKLKGLPVGNASISADAFPVACNKIGNGGKPTWYSDAEVIRIFANKVTHVSLAMIHNGQVSVGVDFDEDNAPDQERAGPRGRRLLEPEGVPRSAGARRLGQGDPHRGRHGRHQARRHHALPPRRHSSTARARSTTATAPSPGS